jgi:glycine C-acetyltransferase
MKANTRYFGGENFDLRDILLKGRSLRLDERAAFFGTFLQSVDQRGENLCMRRVTSPSDREIEVLDPVLGSRRRMVMFGSNNYLGLATHPLVIERASLALKEFGAGVGGPPLLNGHTSLHHELEERLAAFKGTEDAMIFSSGYGANVGLVSGLMGRNDIVIYDAYSHASFCDGIRLSGAQARMFRHNDLEHLRLMLGDAAGKAHGDVFVGVEGVYSMDGDLAPLDRMLSLCGEYGAHLVLDDAHGTGVMGLHGRGTAEQFGVEGEIPLTMGTFSKVFAVTGGFVAARKSFIDYLRYFGRSYMFSASLPPVVVATVLAGLDVLALEPDRIARLHDNMAYTASALRRIGFSTPSQSAIFPLRVPATMDIRSAARAFHDRGIFLNSVEYPAVPASQQRFRVSVMATHTHEDIDRLTTAVEEIWSQFADISMEERHDTDQCSAA